MTARIGQLVLFVFVGENDLWNNATQHQVINLNSNAGSYGRWQWIQTQRVVIITQCRLDLRRQGRQMTLIQDCLYELRNGYSA